MPYSSLFFHLGPISHYLFAFILLFVFVPGVLFKTHYDQLADRVLSKFITMVFTIIVLGYLLTLTKLFEVMSISIVLTIMLITRYWRFLKKFNQKPTISYLMKSLFDLLEGLHYIDRKVVKGWLFIKINFILVYLKEKYKLESAIEFFSFIVILSISIYIRFFDAIKNAAPPLSDSYVTLAWMKYIDAREVFHDGIYPQGFHIFLSILLKFSAIDGLFVLRYTGPFNAIFITLGLYFMIKKLTNNRIGALIAITIYGYLLATIQWFPIERQVGTNSQEFAFIFIFPVLYFLIKYCLFNKIQDLYYGMLGTAVIGLVHTFAFAFIGVLIGVLLICYFIKERKISIAFIKLVLYSLLTVVIALLPIGIGLLIGKDLHSSSVDYLTASSNKIDFPDLVQIDVISLLCLLTILLLLFKKGMSKNDRFIGLFTILAGGGTFSIYYFGGSLTNSVLIASRSLELWGLLVPFTIGICFSLVCKQLPLPWSKLPHFIMLVYLCTSLLYFKPSPIIGYKLEHNANIEQYLKIREYQQKSWLMVSNDEGYAVVLGTGFHMQLHDFINTYDPAEKSLTKIGETKPNEYLPPHVFILLEKNIFKVSNTNSIYSILEPKYKQRQQDFTKLTNWLNEHKAKGFKVKTFYEDANIIIYYLEVESSQEESIKNY
jgi:hypothetical protein